jgi:nucleoside 2-deoxyribosyltransferase
MKLYLAHSTSFDYLREFYEPLRRELSDHEIVYPHDENSEGVKSKEVIPTCDAVIAEVSFPSTGQGIELGWADANNVPIICIYRKGSSVSTALRFISHEQYEYTSEVDMINQISVALDTLAVDQDR